MTSNEQSIALEQGIKQGSVQEEAAVFRPTNICSTVTCAAIPHGPASFLVFPTCYTPSSSSPFFLTTSPSTTTAPSTTDQHQNGTQNYYHQQVTNHQQGGMIPLLLVQNRSHTVTKKESPVSHRHAQMNGCDYQDDDHEGCNHDEDGGCDERKSKQGHYTYLAPPPQDYEQEAPRHLGQEHHSASGSTSSGTLQDVTSTTSTNNTANHCQYSPSWNSSSIQPSTSYAISSPSRTTTSNTPLPADSYVGLSSRQFPFKNANAPHAHHDSSKHPPAVQNSIQDVQQQNTIMLPSDNVIPTISGFQSTPIQYWHHHPGNFDLFHPTTAPPGMMVVSDNSSQYLYYPPQQIPFQNDPGILWIVDEPNSTSSSAAYQGFFVPVSEQGLMNDNARSNQHPYIDGTNSKDPNLQQQYNHKKRSYIHDQSQNQKQKKPSMATTSTRNHQHSSTTKNNINAVERHLNTTSKQSQSTTKTNKLLAQMDQEKPRRPLTAYNFFFSEERERIIAEMSKDPNRVSSSPLIGDQESCSAITIDGSSNSMSHDDLQVSIASSDEEVSSPQEKNKYMNDDEDKNGQDKGNDPADMEGKIRAKTAKLLASRRYCDRPKRKSHKKQHGVVSFHTLCKLVAQRWKELPQEQKQYYIDLAKSDVERYREDMTEYARKRAKAVSTTEIDN